MDSMCEELSYIWAMTIRCNHNDFDVAPGSSVSQCWQIQPC